MGGRKKWSSAARSPFATIRGHLGPRRKGVEGLCVSSLLGVLRSHTWLIGEEDVAVLLAHSSLPRYQHHRAHSLSFSLCSSSADGGSEDLADPRSPSLDPHLSHVGQGKQTKIPLDSYFFFCFCLSLKLTTLKYLSANYVPVACVHVFYVILVLSPNSSSVKRLYFLAGCYYI